MVTQMVAESVAAAAEGVAAVEALPGLSIMGRWFLQLAQQYQQQKQQQQDEQAAASPSKLCITEDLGLSIIQYWCLVMQQWLQSSSIDAQLTAAGYDPQGVLQQLEQLVTASQALHCANSSSSSSSEPVSSVACVRLPAAPAAAAAADPKSSSAIVSTNP
jgi:hypothetical protein